MKVMEEDKNKKLPSRRKAKPKMIRADLINLSEWRE
ncbi:protein of unknown function [Brochothrix thermosphacta]|uniref:Uncharacterized protein n=1 Tax=Brochothrix thermosphacta TaxID=2756 RepID=A0A2X0QX17_BROTH|nr:protein of unknown function [Brochothrix thermosphacta]SPP25734.1 hypothetical protein BTBSAS_10112 [Brochothrix thermosphacta]